MSGIAAAIGRCHHYWRAFEIDEKLGPCKTRVVHNMLPSMRRLSAILIRFKCKDRDLLGAGPRSSGWYDMANDEHPNLGLLQRPTMTHTNAAN